MALVKFDLDVDAAGDGTYVIDGQDLSGQVAGAVVEIERGQLPVVTLIQRTGGGRIVGEGIVQAQAPDDMLGQLADLLDAVDVEALEQRALNSPELGHGPAAVTRECLRLLAEQVRGRS